MNFIVPVSHNNKEEAIITLLNDVKHWAYIEMGEGEMSKCDFFDKREDSAYMFRELHDLNV